MSDIALFWDSRLLFEKFFIEHGFNYQLIHPRIMGSHFLPAFRMILIPTGFANPNYSTMLPSLIQNRGKIERFIKNGGTLLVYGALIESHSYEWLPVDMEYIHRYGPVKLSEKYQSEASLLAGDTMLECDGFFCRSEGECVLVNDTGNAVLVKIDRGKGRIFATTIHEFPTPEFIHWTLSVSLPNTL